MNPENPGPGPGSDELREAEINALIDGELSAEAVAELKARAAADPALARAIVAAFELQRSLDALRPERAPGRLRRRLKRIPREHGYRARAPRWAVGAAFGSVVLAAVAMMMTIPGPGPSDPAPQQAGRDPGEDEALARRARHDLGVAFSYLDKIGFRTAREMQQVLDDELAEPVRSQLSRHLPYTAQNRKENHS